TRSFVVDTTPPTISSASIDPDGVTVTVTWSENLDTSQAVSGAAFSISRNGGAGIPGTAAAVSYPTQNQTRFTLSSTVHHLDNLSLTYTKPGSGAVVRDTATPTGNAAATASLGNVSISNNTGNQTPNVPALVSPTSGSQLASATPSLTATFSDPDDNDTGTLTFQVCRNATCTAGGDPQQTFSSAAGIANNTNGSASVPASLADGTYYWRAKATDSSSASSGYSTTQSFVVDTTPPTISSASVAADGATVTVTWNEPLDQTQAVAGSAFSVNGIAGTGTVSYASATQLTFSLASAVHHLDVLTLGYTKPGSGAVVRDTATPTGNAAATVSGVATTNNTADLNPSTPALVSPVNSAQPNTKTPTLTATFSDPDPNDFGKVTFQVCAVSDCSSQLATFDSTSTSIANGSNGSASVPAGAITTDGVYFWRAKNVDSSSNSGAYSSTRSFTVDTTAPTITSAAVGANGTSVTVTWSEALDPSQAVAGSAFSINGIAGTGTVAYAGANTQTTFSLASAVHHLDVLTLGYTTPGSGAVVRDPATPTGNAAATVSGVAVTNNTADAAPSTPALVSPADGLRANTATPALTATFSDPDPNDTGTLTFQVCTTAACSAPGDPVSTFSTAAGIANGTNGTASVPAAANLADGTYYWRASAKDSASTTSSNSATRSFVVDTTPPTIASASIAADGTTVTVTWSEPLDTLQGVAGSAFSVNGIAGTGTVSYPTGTQTTFVLASAVHHLDVLALSYTKPGSGAMIRDAASPTGNAASSASGVSVTNGTADTAPPTLSATFADPDPNDTGKITFQVCSDSGCTTPLQTFDSSSTSIANGANGSASPSALADGVYYWRAKNVDSSSTASSYSATRAITIDTTPATMQSASIASDGTTVTVTWSENLDQTQAVTGSAFSVAPNGGAAIQGTASAVTYPSANQTRFTLSAPVHHLDSLQLTYTKPGSGATILDTAQP